MSWLYRIPTGEMSQNGKVRPEWCYSGYGECRNDPAKCGVVMQGPIPPGKYRFGHAYKHDHLGALTMDLTPLPGTNTLGRSLFRIHGDSRDHPGDASHGCIVAPLLLRVAMDASQDRILEVVV